jgi:L-seryl-tRNA(Ser) seleniumtransferase
MSGHRASLPAIGRMLARADVRALVAFSGKGTVTDALRAAVARAREAGMVTDESTIVAAAALELAKASRGTLVPVINATGVVLHTNLGRAPLCEEARDAAVRAGSGYSSLEMDLSTGERGSRHDHAAARLRRLTGAEDALVANNAAAALMLSLSALARGAPVIVSRGELVEIGGAFRIPDVVRSGGATLVEVGTTNRTRAADYSRALTQSPGGVLLKVHRSNFEIVGFTEEVEIDALVKIARANDPPALVVYDLGSGLLVSGRSVGLPAEPDVPAAIAAGADVVVFSGDKLLGGPQAGIAVGRRASIAAMRGHPLMRALRAGKLVLAALDATLAVYERGPDAVRALPVMRSLVEDIATVRARAARLSERLGGTVVDAIARVGGGAQPTATIASAAVRLPDVRPDALAAELRRGTPAVVGRIDDGALHLDVRTVGDDELDALAARIEAARAVVPV